MESHATKSIHLARIAEGRVHGRMARIRTRTAMSKGRQGPMARAGHAIQQVVRSREAKRTSGSTSDGNHASREDPFLWRSDRRQNCSGSSTRAGARSGTDPSESKWREPAGMDGDLRQGPVLA